MTSPWTNAVERVAAALGIADGAYYDEVREVVHERLEAAAPIAAELRGAANHAPWQRPETQNDPLNAIVRWCDIAPTGEGPLSGRTISVKDSIFVAGVPATCGYSGLEDFVPTAHATIVDRILRAGGRIVATTNMDCFGFAASGATSSYGPTQNPNSIDHLAGGSSNGAAAALSYPGIDISVGCDQGGSIRIPAAWCGVLGLKPTHGWIPYTGIAGIDQIIDHTGPMARSVSDIADMMDVLVGRDGIDPRQPEVVPEARFGYRVRNPRNNLEGIRIGVLDEGMDLTREHGATDVIAAVEATCRELKAMGAQIQRVSVPEHLTIGVASFVCNLEGMASLLRSGGHGYGHLGRYDVEFATRLSAALQDRADELSPQVKVAWLAGTTMADTYGGALYAAARNALADQIAGYAKVFADVDMLIMPTTPFGPLRTADASGADKSLAVGWSMLGNTAPFNATGMPALSMPVGRSNGLPVGAMLVGPKGADAELLDVARLYETTVGWDLAPELAMAEPDWER
ncbi:amidase family protein [[Mycobacterium] wendilense]|uniref:Amidase family protein n=1 Tax=[Mycobacterium] wendilense TaxID=3064284 RepID=A0ABM9M9P0_9MYCO|nr:amidase family protein [Mycolicibacterium sp. MU0050]CAJ1579874.1 amidase family protein [Mycolicibacterium sp. MU0050]